MRLTWTCSWLLGRLGEGENEIAVRSRDTDRGIYNRI